MITIVDYGVGNLGSIYNMFKKIGVQALVSSNPSEIEKATKLVLPGVGSFDYAMKNLQNSGYIPVLNQKVLGEQIPILGICLGMQLLTKKSEEGNSAGLGLIDAETVKFEFNKENGGLRIPHMGWNDLKAVKKSPILMNMYEDARFYFVHSYHVVCKNADDVLAKTFYGYEFTSMIQHQNIFGTQFHPEKSHKFGLKLLKNFTELVLPC